jgi:aspartyl-tRNA(Asn)/glutamyl-tRNA(Gln) amidotransferase subunit B
MDLLNEGKITSRVAKDILNEVVFSHADAHEIAESRGLVQQSDMGALKVIVAQIIADNETVVREYKTGKETSIQFLIGQGMKLSRGTANPSVLKQLLVDEMSR